MNKIPLSKIRNKYKILKKVGNTKKEKFLQRSFRNFKKNNANKKY